MGKIQPPRPIDRGDASLTDSFDCEEPELTTWLKKYAWLSHSSRSACVYVCLNDSGTEVVAYYSLSSGSAVKADASERIRDGMPNEIPIQLIGRLGVDRRYKGQGVGAVLILDALKRVLWISRLTGVRAVMVRSKPGAIGFYQHLEFEQSESDPALFFLMVKDIAKRLEVVESKAPSA